MSEARKQRNSWAAVLKRAADPGRVLEDAQELERLERLRLDVRRLELGEPQQVVRERPPRRRGRPAYDPADLRAARHALRSAGMPETQEDCVALLGWDRKTVANHWPASELDGE